MLEDSLEVHRRNGNARMVANALALLVRPALARRGIDTALALTREALEAARGAGGPWVESAALWQVGVCLAVRGKLDAAERASRRPSTLRGSSGCPERRRGLKSVGGVALKRDDHERSRLLFDESLTIFRSLDDAWGISNSLANLAFLALEAGDAETAHVLLSKALAIERDISHHPAREPLEMRS